MATKEDVKEKGAGKDDKAAPADAKPAADPAAAK